MMRTSLCALLITALAGPAQAAPTRLVSQAEDAYALGLNPAGLALSPGSELRAFWGALPKDDWREGSAGGYGLLTFGRLALAGGAERWDDRAGEDGHRFGFGLGLRLGQASAIGASWTRGRFGDGGTHGQWNFGLSSRPTSWLGLGASLSDASDSANRRRWALGLTLRPVSWLRLSGQWRSKRQRAGLDTELIGLLELEPLTGLRLGGGLDQDGRPLAQLSFGFAFSTLGAELQLGPEREPQLIGEVALHRRRPGLSAPGRARVVALDLSGALVAEPSFSLWSGGVRTAAYGDHLYALNALSTAEAVDGVFLKIGALSVGWAKAEELRAAIRALRAAGRPVDCLLLAAGDLPYYVASACRSVAALPALQLRVNGVDAELLFFGDTLKRVGVKVEVARRGAYKSAPEALTEAGMSPAQAEALGAYLDVVQDKLQRGIAKSRGMSPAEVRAAMGQGILTSTAAKARGLVDAVLYPDEVEGALRARYGRAVELLSLRQALPPQPRWGEPPQVAVLHIDRAITAGKSQDLLFGLGRTLGGDSLVEAIDALGRDGSIKAVVLRVDSPGGDALASDLVARAVQRLAAHKPVIASFGDVAASGGYYVAAPAKAIYAEPTTLTGSIGVFGLKPSLQGLRERLGIGAARLNRGGPKLGSIYFDGDAAERELWERGVEAAYQRFLGVVAEGRGMSRAQVKAVAEGRIWSGADAKARGLVDEFGGLQEAIERARAEAGLRGRVRLVNYPQDLVPITAALSRREPPPELAGLSPALLQLALLWSSGARAQLAALSPFSLSLR